MCDVCPPLERHERQQETDGQRGVSSVLLKACKGCGRLIPQALTMCEQCEARQQSRHVTYNNTRRDPRAAEFYLSKEWRELRPVIMSVYEYVDIYALYVEHQLITLKDSDPIHHIIELEEDWEQRLNPLNLIPLSHRTHNTITGGHHLIRGNRCRTGDQCSCTAGQSDSVRAVVRERILEKVI